MRSRAAAITFSLAALLATSALLGADAPLPDSPPAPLAQPAPVASPASAIVDVSITPDPVQVGKPISVVVHTTPDVTAMQGSVLSFKFAIPKTGDDTFSGSSKVPFWAHLFHGKFNIVLTATTDTGAHPQVVEPVSI